VQLCGCTIKTNWVSLRPCVEDHIALNEAVNLLPRRSGSFKFWRFRSSWDNFSHTFRNSYLWATSISLQRTIFRRFENVFRWFLHWISWMSAPYYYFRHVCRRPMFRLHGDNFHQVWSWYDHPLLCYSDLAADALRDFMTLTFALLTLASGHTWRITWSTPPASLNIQRGAYPYLSYELWHHSMPLTKIRLQSLRMRRMTWPVCMGWWWKFSHIFKIPDPDMSIH